MNQFREWTGYCQRCGEESNVHIMSTFDVSLICMGCYDLEKKHPYYEKAKSAEEKAVKEGNSNFEGVKWPYREIANDPIDW